MKIITIKLCAILACIAMLSSCLNSDDDDANSGYADTAITQFTLGTLNRYTSTTSSATGNDTVIKTTLTGSTYPMTINHQNRTIYNSNELPVGTDIKHVVCTITAKNSGAVAIQSMISDSLQWHSSTDSVDFSQPRTFRVYSSNLQSYRDYTVTLTVSKTTGINFGWTAKGTLDIANPSEMKLVARDDSVALMPRDNILGAATHEIYKMGADGHLMASADGGESWQTEMLDDDESLLPAPGKASMASWKYATATSADYVLLVGTPRQDDVPYMRVWRKIAQRNGSGQWVYMPVDQANNFAMPRQENLVMAYYNGAVLAIGSDMVMRQSRDEGITWKQNTTYDLPSNLTGTVADMTADNSGRLWLLTTTGQLWLGDVTK